MTKENLILKIEKIDGLWKFTNNSDYTIIISCIPAKLKRKYVDVMTIFSDNFAMIDSKIDLSSLSFRFEYE
jgi:hypothetical protein